MKIRLTHHTGRSASGFVRVKRHLALSREQDCPPFRVLVSSRCASNAFTLLEVIVACAIFFLVGFSILEMVTRSLAAAKSLQNRDPDPGMIASAISLTNRLEEGEMSGNFEDIAPGLYPNWRWLAVVTGAITNGFFKVEIAVHGEGDKRRVAPQPLTIYLYRPESPPWVKL